MYCEKCGKEMSENETICSNCGNMIEYDNLPQNKEKNEFGVFSILGLVLVCIPTIVLSILMFASSFYPSFLISLLFIIPSVVGCAFAGCSFLIYKNTTYKIIAVITLVLFIFFKFYII